MDSLILKPFINYTDYEHTCQHINFKMQDDHKCQNIHFKMQDVKHLSEITLDVIATAKRGARFHPTIGSATPNGFTTSHP
jgi:hypothetical protein